MELSPLDPGSLAPATPLAIPLVGTPLAIPLAGNMTPATPPADTMTPAMTPATPLAVTMTPAMTPVSMVQASVISIGTNWQLFLLNTSLVLVLHYELAEQINI